MDMERPFRKTNTSAYYKSIEKVRYNEDEENDDSGERK